MKRTILVLLVAVLTAAGAAYALIGLRDAGPSAELLRGASWMPITSDVGLVVQDPSADHLDGYLMLKVDGRWKPVALSDTGTRFATPAR